ncbi:MAG: hypothetical protein QOE84_1240 [Actinomycetota bacterium]|jgi:hypothetical protein|nr:hypothetical protein [Actinomycetota bacterium]
MSSVFGLFVVLILLLLAVQVVYDLYATSAVTASAYDAARVVAGSDGGPAATAVAEDAARRSLGRYGQRVSFTWTIDGDAVQLRVVARNPGFLPTALRRPLGVDTVDRTVRLRTERFR